MAPGGAPTPQDDFAASHRYIVVSTDGHVGPSVKEQLRPYCEAAYLDDLDRFVEEMAGAGPLAWRSSETRDGAENWTMGVKPKARKLASDEEAAEFGKAAGFRNPATFPNSAASSSDASRCAFGLTPIVQFSSPSRVSLDRQKRRPAPVISSTNRSKSSRCAASQ